MSCRFAGSDQPRVLAGRHRKGCADQYDTDALRCGGCLPCTEPHCRVCGRTHADGTCAECMAETREALHEIGRMCGALPEEVEHRGVEGEALMLLGPVADPEAWGHVEASVIAGRLDRDWVEAGGGEQHPLTVTLSWQMVWRDALEHDEAPNAELLTAIDYLDRQMTYMAGYEHVPFEDFARDLRRCQSHLESVLHDGEQVERGAPCLTCKRPVRRATLDDGTLRFRCEHCHRDLSENEYRLAVRAAHVAHADRLNISDLSERVETPESTLRSWASVLRVPQRGAPPIEHPPLIRPCGRDGRNRNVYRVDDVLAVRNSGGDRRRSATISIDGVA